MAEERVSRPRGEFSSGPPDILELSSTEMSVAELIRRGLDWVMQVAPADLATVFLLRGERLVAVASRGPLAARSLKGHTLDLAARPTLRQVLETRRARALTEEDHAHGEGDPFDGVLDLPAGHSCMVVPLCAAERCYGALTLDRAVCERYAQGTVERVEVYGQMLAAALHAAQARALAERMHVQDHVHAKRLEAELAGEAEAWLVHARSAGMRELGARLEQVAAGGDTPVLLLGEPGTDRRRLARAVHRASARRDQPFVALHAGAHAPAALEEELFGAEGRLALASGGTLFVDGVDALPPELQDRLLAALDARPDVRLVAGADGELAALQRRLRPELYLRLSTLALRVPPLRERREDLAGIATQLLHEAARRLGRRGARLTREALAALAVQDWPGNERELAAALERALARAPRGGEVGAELLAPAEPAAPAAGALPTLAQVQREHIARVLAATGGRIYGPGGAAEVLGLKPSTLQSRMKKLGVAGRAAAGDADDA